MNEISVILERIRQFRDERDWKQFHDHKSLASSVVIEASELLEHFQWKDKKEALEYAESHKDEIGEEVADVLIYLFEFSDIMNINIKETVLRKIEKNAKKYPIERAKGNSTKYTNL